MKKIVLKSLVLTCFLGWACVGSKEAEFQEFISDSDKLTKEIVTKVKANPTAIGVEEAQKILEAHRPGLRTKFYELKTVEQYRVNDVTMKNFSDNTFTNIDLVNKLKLDYAEKSFKDKVFGDKINKLVADFNALFEF